MTIEKVRKNAITVLSTLLWDGVDWQQLEKFQQQTAIFDINEEAYENAV